MKINFSGGGQPINEKMKSNYKSDEPLSTKIREREREEFIPRNSIKERIRNRKNRFKLLQHLEIHCKQKGCKSVQIIRIEDQ